MNANLLDRALTTPDWITLLMILSLVVLVFLKALNRDKFHGNLTSIFNKGFLEIEAEEKRTPFDLFSVMFTFFSLICISLAIYLGISEWKAQSILLVPYLHTLGFVTFYLIGRFITEYLLIRLFSLNQELNFFFLSKRSYLFAISVGLWLLTVVYLYGSRQISFFLIGCALLVFLRLISVLITNKNLIFNHLFYFILYLCSFEIAPLLVLFKLMTK